MMVALSGDIRVRVIRRIRLDCFKYIPNYQKLEGIQKNSWVTEGGLIRNEQKKRRPRWPPFSVYPDFVSTFGAR